MLEIKITSHNSILRNKNIEQLSGSNNSNFLKKNNII